MLVAAVVVVVLGGGWYRRLGWGGWLAGYSYLIKSPVCSCTFLLIFKFFWGSLFSSFPVILPPFFFFSLFLFLAFCILSLDGLGD